MLMMMLIKLIKMGVRQKQQLPAGQDTPGNIAFREEDHHQEDHHQEEQHQEDHADDDDDVDEEEDHHHH